VGTGFWWGNLRERYHLEDPGVDRRLIFRWIFRNRDGAWTGLIWLRIGQMADSGECGNELPVSIKCEEFLD
jgi:hypothetical protein